MAAGRTPLALGLLLCLFALASCVQDDGTRFNPIRDMTTVSDDDERQLGMDFDRELQKHVRVIQDPVVAGYLNDLGQKIVRNLEPQPFIYRFRVIDDPSLNAFAVPGGYVYFHSGTLLAAGSVDELAGVMGHEIAHVKARHYARMQKASQLPDILAGIAGMAAAVAAREPGILVATQAANIAMKLRFSREYETEADELGAIFMTRAGFQPAAITRFFERILAEKRDSPDRIPPYLFTHPDVEARIAAVTAQAEKLQPTQEQAPSGDPELREAQTRLAQLIDAKRATLPGPPSPDPVLSDDLLAEAERLAAAGQQDAALLQLARAETNEPDDPRVPFRVGELLAAQARHAEAIAGLPPHGAPRPDARARVLQAGPLVPRDRRAAPRGLCLRAGQPARRGRQRAAASRGLGGGEAHLHDRPGVGHLGRRCTGIGRAARPPGGGDRRRRHASDRLVGAARQPLRSLRRSDPRRAGSRQTAAWCRTRRRIARAGLTSDRRSRSMPPARRRPAPGPSKRASTTT